eukprot:CAMPEP_0197577092 /NCGR_PEP_ID=MMETSP1326-20131121/1853_1 /TAXON_ID=1155430 /ORGANISM="Genus nov. species nov., Strain RCC2288" /LENGTH=35 /DNA_ID= /DNA_START= /DNA_END= /DNA_ORIENTATION=
MTNPDEIQRPPKEMGTTRELGDYKGEKMSSEGSGA